MSKTAKILLSLAVLGVAYVVYRKIRKSRTTTLVPNSTNGPQIGDGGLPSGGSSEPPVDTNFGCVSGSAYANTCTTINFTNPDANMGCCGRQVYNLQRGLNQLLSLGLVEDGKYGTATKQGHVQARQAAATPTDFPGVNFSF